MPPRGGLAGRVLPSFGEKLAGPTELGQLSLKFGMGSLPGR
jgi:hypothetical protein